MDLQENIYKKVKRTYYMLAGSAGQHVVGFWDLNIDIFLEVQDQKYSYILYLLDDIAPGPQFWYKLEFSPEIAQNLNKSRFTNKKPGKGG